MHARLPAPPRCAVMGILNVTPDSFSDGGRYLNREAAIEHGVEMHRMGADVIDVGGESTRPGSERVDAATELDRVLPVVRDLVAEGVPVSVDTTRAEVAEATAEAGASVINDVSGGKADPAMIPTAAELAVPYVLMHWRGHSADMQSRASYTDLIAEVMQELRGQAAEAMAAGITADRLLIDPGLGFAKTGEHNWELLQHLDDLTGLGHPLLLGVSRKRFLGSLLAAPDGTPRPPRERDDASAALSGWAAMHDIWGVRVHTVRPSRDNLAVLSRLGVIGGESSRADRQD